MTSDRGTFLPTRRTVEVAEHARSAVHELSVCGSIADIVARRAHGRRVDTIHIRIGQLRQIVPDTLVYCWSVVIADTTLDGSSLEVESVPARINCQVCGVTQEVGYYPLLLCAACDSADVTVVTGEEFLITSLDLAEV
jgi:hydrogenase nickel incorporation protein HypA/HybF